MDARKVLLVFPTARVLDYFESMVTGYGFEPLRAASLKEGLIYAWRDRPYIILFDADLQDMAPLAFAQKIHQDSRSAEALLVAIGEDSSFQTESAFLAAGCTAYLKKSPDMVTALTEFLLNPSGAAVVFKHAAGRQIVFLSAKGGVGTSTLCANFADNFSRQLQAKKRADMLTEEEALKVCVADLVLPIGSIAPLVGYADDFNIVTLSAAAPDEVNKYYVNEKLVRPEHWAFKLLPGAPDPEQASHLTVGRIPAIMDILRRSFDYVFVDLGRSLSRISLPLILNADLVVMVVGNDLSTVRLTKIVLDYLAKNNLPMQRLFIVLNRAIGLEGLTRERIEAMLGHPVQMTVPYMRDNFTVANNQHMPFLVKYPANTMGLILRDGAQRMLQFLQKLSEDNANV